MAIRELATTHTCEAIKSTRVLAETAYRTVDDAMAELEPLAEIINDSLQLLSLNQKQLASLISAGTIFRVVDESIGPAPKGSPAARPADKVRIQGLKELRKNYLVTQNLFATIQALDTVEANIRASMGEMPKADKALQEVANLRAKANQGLKDAFQFLSSLAHKNLPKVFESFIEKMGNVLETSVSYEEATSYLYVYEVDGDIVFSNYVQLKGLIDEDGRTHDSILVVLSYRTGDSPKFYVNTMKTFEPPSIDVLVKEVKSIKEAIHALNLLFYLDGFANNIGALPLKMLLKQEVNRNLFSNYGAYVADVEVDETTLTFRFKNSVTTEVMRKVLPQLYLDVKGAFRNTRAKLRVDTRKDGKHWVASFFFKKADGGPAIEESELDFLKHRFGLGDEAVSKIMRLING